MKRLFKPALSLLCLGVLAWACGPAVAQAGHGHGSSGGSSGGSYGSSGGSYGSHGSSGGSYGSHGSSGGSYGSHGSSGGSYGSHGSSGGSYGSHGSSGGSYGSHGSSGGYYTTQHSYGGGGHYASAPQYYSRSQTQVVRRESASQPARLVLNVPETSKVYLEGQLMTSTGSLRRFVSPQLEQGKSYIYTVRIDVEQDGRTISKTTKANVTAGQQVEIAVDFDRNNPNQLVANIR